MGKFVVVLTEKAKADIVQHKKSGNKSNELTLRKDIHIILFYEDKQISFVGYIDGLPVINSKVSYCDEFITSVGQSN
jgi:hypothetical protein